MTSLDAAPAFASRPASPWIVSAPFDLALFSLSAAVTLIPWVAADLYHVPSFYILAAVAIASNGPHLVSTWTRVYMDGHERFRRPVHYFVIPISIAGAVLATIILDGRNTPWLRTILFYWASWHFAAQCYGLLRIYQRKHGVIDTSIAHLEKALLFSGTGWCVLHRLFTGPWTLFGGPVWHPSPPAMLVNGVGMGVVILAITYVLWCTTRWLRGERPDLRRPLFIGSTIGAFAAPFLLIREGTAAFAAAACWHGLQYIGIVWFYNRNRYRTGYEQSAAIMSFVSQPHRGLLYFLTLLAVAGVVYGALIGISTATAAMSWDFGTWSLFVWTSLTFSHYYLDGVIWKLKSDRSLTEHLQAA